MRALRWGVWNPAVGFVQTWSTAQAWAPHLLQEEVTSSSHPGASQHTTGSGDLGLG